MSSGKTFLLDQAAKLYPEKIAIRSQEGEMTYREYLHLVCSVMEKLQEHGVSPKSYCAILRKPDIISLATLMALLRLKAIAVPLSLRLSPVQVQKLLEELSCSYLVTSQDLLPLYPNLKTIRWQKEDFLSFPSSSKMVTIDLQDRSTVIFSSGSTGKPKAILHSYGNHYYSALGANLNMPLSPGSSWLLSLPIYHVGGLAILMRCVLAGAAVTLPSSQENLIANIQKFKVTHLSLVSTQLQRLLEEEENLYWQESLQAILLGGSFFPTNLLEKAQQRKLPIHMSYGSSEMSSQITTTPKNSSLEDLSTSGQLLPYRQLKISEEGEILLKGKTLFQGYLKKGNLFSPFDTEGWFASGDCGYWNENKCLVVTGRQDEMFISGGENIYPTEIELVLSKYPGIIQTVIVPVENLEYGKRPVAFIQSELTWKEEDLKTYLQGKLEKFKVPDYFFSWPKKLPSVGMKVNREGLKSIAQERCALKRKMEK